MASLSHAQRISYKATYCQISPAQTATVTSVPPTGRLSRAVEKTAFLQSLRIVAAELAAIRRQPASPSDASLPTGHETQLPDAYQAIERLIADQTGTSTLNNAALFANISPATLIACAQQLTAYRAQIRQSITKSVAEILAAYRASLVPPPATNAGSSIAGAAKPSKGTTIQKGETANGLPIITTVAPLAAAKAPASAPTRSAAAKKVDLRGQSVAVTIDETRPLPPAFSSSLAADAVASYHPSNAAAIAWAQKAHPRLFATLSQQLQPYTGVTLDERAAAGDAHALLGTLQSVFATVLDGSKVGGAINGFQSRMTVEPVGNLHLERVEMYPAGLERGELAHTVPLAPGETVNISHKEWSVTERKFEDIVQDFFEGYSEQGVAEKNDIAMSTDTQTQHATALNVGSSLSASYGAVTLSSNFGYSATSNDAQSKKDSRNHSMEITKKASARTKKDHKITFKVTSVVGSEDQSVRVISNPSATDTMRIDYFQLARRWKVDLLRYGLRMTYDIVIPNPGAGIVKLVEDVKALEALISTPFMFSLPLTAIYYNSLATDPHLISNYDALAAEYDAPVTAPLEARKWVNVHPDMWLSI